MSKEETTKIIVARWFKNLRVTAADLSVVDELGAPNVLFQYPSSANPSNHSGRNEEESNLRDQ